MVTSNLTFNERFNQFVWAFLLYPVWPWVERSFNFLHKKERQPYHIGWLAPGKSIDDLKSHLSRVHGFGNHFVAWTDPGQILSWRKLVNFRWQYHIRVFSDGEIRGHFEVTPEAAPVKHFLAQGEQNRKEDFFAFLGDIVTVKKHISRLEHRKSYEQIGFSTSGFNVTKIYKVPLMNR